MKLGNTVTLAEVIHLCLYSRMATLTVAEATHLSLSSGTHSQKKTLCQCMDKPRWVLYCESVEVSWENASVVY